MSAPDCRHWVRFYAYRYELLERIEYQLAQVCSLLAAGFFRQDSSPADWLQSDPAAEQQDEVYHLADRDLAFELARSLGAEVRYIN